MDYQLAKVKYQAKDKLYRLLEYSLYEGSFYMDKDVNDECLFEYKWFDNYFTDDDRDAYFIKTNNKYIGYVMVNENLKFNKCGKCIAEFFIMPKYRRNHVGKNVAFEIFDMYQGDWEVQPMENNINAYSFWSNIIKEYTNGNYTIKNDGIEDVFIFKSR